MPPSNRSSKTWAPRNEYRNQRADLSFRSARDIGLSSNSAERRALPQSSLYSGTITKTSVSEWMVAIPARAWDPLSTSPSTVGSLSARATRWSKAEVTDAVSGHLPRSQTDIRLVDLVRPAGTQLFVTPS